MKIRNGFVSNSSSSSFVVRLQEDKFFIRNNADFIVNAEDISKLEEYGFEKSNLTTPFDTKDTIIKSGDSYISMKYHVHCNQDEVITFLVENNIPFKASCHYGHVFMSYKKDSDYIFEAYNFGNVVDMYGEGHAEELTDIMPFKKAPKTEYL